MVIDHIGIVVRSIEHAAEDWKALFGYEPSTLPVVNTRQKVKVVFLSKPGSIDVKLVEPTDDSSAVAPAAKRGGGLHHLCFRCQDLSSETVRLKAMGIRVLAEPQPGEAFENEQIAFFYIGSGLNVEIIDTLKRARKVS